MIQKDDLPEKPKKQLALCLSGGGFRAALFHLGALRRLNEFGILSKVDTIPAVSGGSILAALLADFASKEGWPEAGDKITEDVWEQDIVKPFRKFASRDLRTRAILKRAMPWNWKRPSCTAEYLAQQYESLTDLTLRHLPDRPWFIFCASELYTGGLIGFTKRIGIDPYAYWPVSIAVAASSSFPPFFGPLSLDPEKYLQLPEVRIIKDDQVEVIKPNRKLLAAFPFILSISSLRESDEKAGLTKKAREERLKMMIDHHVRYKTSYHLTDGGLIDNTGLTIVRNTHKEGAVLVSDGGAVFREEWRKGFFWSLSRYSEIVGHHAHQRLIDSLLGEFDRKERTGGIWSLNTTTELFGIAPEAFESGYSPDIVHKTISHIRTDLDGFSEGESAVLENHGYSVANAAIKHFVPGLINEDAPFKMPNPNWMEESVVLSALKHSHQRNYLPIKRTSRWRIKPPGTKKTA